MKQYRLYILDLDGTLYRGEEALPNTVSTVRTLRDRGAMIRFLTNNSGQTRQFYRSKLQRLGFDAALDEISSSAIAAAKVCKERGHEKVFFVGEPSLRDTFLECGLSVINKDEGALSQANAVVAGICRNLTYRWINGALQQIIGGAQFIATNTDATFPMEGARVEPGAGAVVAAIQTCSGKDPFVIGKPNPLMIEMILRDSGVSADDALAVGDRYETDILSGENAGVATHLVLTGVTQRAPDGVSHSADLSGIL